MRNHIRYAFTLIELLIVISIIMILIAILLPALSGSRKEASKTQCLTRIREVYVAHAEYLHNEPSLPPMNNDEDDGTWQYNYLIWDGVDFDNNFGPIIRFSGMADDPTPFFCPVQRDPFHSIRTAENPWPVREGFDTRAGYSRRYHVSGRSLSQMKTIALFSDVIHYPDVVEQAHVTGVNVAYSDGHAKWVPDPGILTNNELARPFSLMDNAIIEDLWDALDERM